MSKPGKIYKIIHQSFDPSSDVQCITELSDYDNLIPDDQDPQVIELIGAGDPQTISCIDTDEDPFTPIRAQQLVLKFISANGVNMNTFASGSDQRWGVHSYIGTDTQTIFKGWMYMEDLSEPFMPEGNIVTLKANDGLGTLKALPLVDSTGLNPAGVHRIIDYIAWCLGGTGLQLQINCAFNIKNQAAIDDISIPNSNEQHFFSLNFLEAKTFESSIGESVNMYEVLRTILGEEAVIFQRQGMWWIMRIDEVESLARGLFISTYAYDGEFIENLGEKNFDKTIKIDGTIFFSKEETEVIPARPIGKLKLKYPYATPVEIPCNKDFERGDLRSEISATEKTYEIDCWFFAENKANGLDSEAAVGDAYITRTFNAVDYEDERYVTIEEGVGVHDQATLKSEAIYIHQGDKFEVAVDFRLNADIGDLLVNALAVELVADDGTYWYMLETGFWFPYPASPWAQILPLNFDTTGQDNTEWQTISAQSNEAPRTGRLYIHLMQVAPEGSTIIYFDNLRFDYYPKINGSHRKYVAQSQTVTQDGGYKATRERDVLISNSPKRLFKGALLEFLLYAELYSGSVTFGSPNAFSLPGDKRNKFSRGQRIIIQSSVSNNQQTVVTDVIYHIFSDTTEIQVSGTTVNEIGTAVISEETYKLAGNYYNAAVFPAGPPSAGYAHPYSELQVFDVWNQFNTDKRVFQATCQGMDLSTVDDLGRVNNAHLVHKWFFLDADYSTYNRIFLLLTFNQDYRTQEWTCVFREVNNYTVDKVYTGRVFRYETE